MLRTAEKRREHEGSAGVAERSIWARAYTYCQDRGIDDTKQPLTPALSPFEGAREKPAQLLV